ncbi:hypothetical protein HII31_11042 [Pseudocercospora fuligena]|uniref:Extracellular membrane protein CFEM domain-containing protein n=1 Tax=Pseudocercospora fuligena TaxID=685502 RepID=A0A8H6RAZ4_9PEZI|nr:hypothetical protein HII31_11042 [Pseudocercospora fuligena]
MRAITITTAALSLIAAVFAPGVDADKRECALCLVEAGGLSGCEAEAHGVPTMSCLCNYPGYSTYKLCNSRCEGPNGWPEKAPSYVCKNYTTNASSEIFTTTSTTTDDKKIVDRAASATEVSHVLPKTAPELGSQRLAATTQSHPTIEVTLSGRQAAAQSSTPTITLDESEAYSMGLITYVSITGTGPHMYSTLTGSPNGTIEARSKVTQGPYHFCGVPGGACPNREGDILPTSHPVPTIEARSKVTHGPYVFCGVPGAPCGGKVNDILPTSHPVPTILTKRHEGHNDTAARWSNTTDTDFNSTSRPGGQPPTGAAAESKGRKLDSNREKVWLIAVLTAGVVAFAQLKRSL